ncbi:MAG: glucose-6-phosphate isomerase [Bifidobacteriaceae bacterium]|jgi:glucose-6-phosphate isomerase|nr:glucose-6-phosphate isomerase [Bifidobacteriaceae bacterium]
MQINKPTDITNTKEWKKLQKHFSTISKGLSKNLSLRELFNKNPNRAKEFSYSVGDLYIDLSKNLITDETVGLLTNLAEKCDLKSAIHSQFFGDHINVTEDRAVLHTALRRKDTDILEVDGQNVVADVREVLFKMYEFADKVRSGEWSGITGKKIQTVVNIGIGGSDLGPVMVYEALKPYADAGIAARFVSNIDPSDFYEKTSDLDPETTLFIICSKTFTTLETLTNARIAKKWLLDKLNAKGITDNAESVRKHFVAVSTALDLVSEFGIDPKNAFGFWNWVGGRYSVDSAVGLSLALTLGPRNFENFLSGFRDVDNYFYNTDLKENVVVIMAMLNIWYVNFFGAATHAVLPYCQYLHRFPAYLQQLTMESNGKSVRWDSSPVLTDTGEVFWGEAGTNGQHAFYQLIHQGTRLIPTDFIAVANPPHPIKDDVDGKQKDVHELFLANFFAQTKALAFGKTADEVRAEGTSEKIVPARVFAGNRPSTSIMSAELTPAFVGNLIALYEQITFVQGIIWGVDSFDQWGVELGKQLALQIEPAISSDNDALQTQDSSTQNLINFYRQNRK